MGMVGCFAAVDRKILDQLRNDPSQIEEYLYPNDGEDEAPNSIDIDKAWHGIHFLLTGQADGGKEPFSLAVLGGEEIGDDVGYGPARFLTPEQVSQVSVALQSISDDDLVSRFSPETMERLEIYPDVIWVRDSKEAFRYLVDNYHQLVDFYREAAKRHDGAILWLC